MRYTFNCNYGNYKPDGQPHELEEEVVAKLLPDGLISEFKGEPIKSEAQADLKTAQDNLTVEKEAKEQAQADLKTAVDLAKQAIKLGQHKKPEGFDEFVAGLES